MKRMSFIMGLVLATSSTVHAAPSPTSDEDGDGLTLAEEERGWIVTANRTGVVIDPITGLENKGDVFEVVSDPTLGDTDGDGLTDGEERAAKTDPTNPDTDLDELSDYDEINR